MNNLTFCVGAGFSLTLNLTGGVGGSMVSFVLPAMIYERLMPNDTFMYKQAVVTKYVGVVIMIIVAIMTIITL